MKKLISERDHERVLAAGVDVPEEQPSFPIALSEVGISAKTVWVRLPQGRLPFSARIMVNLAPDIRGIHMSRMEEAVSELADREFADLRDYVLMLGERVLANQKAQSGEISLEGKLPWERQAPVSRKVSHDAVEIAAVISFDKLSQAFEPRIMISAAVDHITVCPCTQAYNRILFGAEPERNSCPLPTHSQRSCTRLTVGADRKQPEYSQLVACLESALHVTQDLLKRPDEAEIVIRSHQYPQFAEDAVRQTARAVGLHFGGMLPAATRVIIETRSFESIHSHDVHCRLDSTLAEILALFPFPSGTE